MEAAIKINPSTLLLIPVLILHFFTPHASAVAGECNSQSSNGCRNKSEAFKLKLIAVAAILVSSMIGVSLPMLSRSLPFLHPDNDMFLLVKAFASGVILATGYMHVLPDSFESLNSECLPENPWKKFPFSTFVAMVSAIFTLMVDSYAMSFYKRRQREASKLSAHGNSDGTAALESQDAVGHHCHHTVMTDESVSQLLRHRIVAQVLELGIVVHSVVIGLSYGASESVCTLRPLLVALCFHQFFEGMGLGGCILQAEYGKKIKAIMVFFFSATTPFGIVLGIALSKVYSDSSPTALIVVGILDACSAGLLNYTALVDLLGADFLGPRLQKSMLLQTWAFVAVLLGAGGMSLMAKWA